MVLLITKILFLLLLANGGPVIAKRLLGDRLSVAVDGGRQFPDGRPWFGSSKTVRGIIVSVVITALGAVMIGYPWQIGALFGIAAMGGDLVSSFIKRRLGLAPSSRAIGLDQVPESALPMLACWQALGLTPAIALVVLVVFLVGELLLSKLLFRLNVRDRPY